jgi:hypothetical protein
MTTVLSLSDSDRTEIHEAVHALVAAHEWLGGSGSPGSK